MDIEIFLCEEHYEKTEKKWGPIKSSIRVKGFVGSCLVPQCIRDIAWVVNVRLPERNLVKGKDVK